MFWKKNKDGKLAGPKEVPEIVRKKVESTQMIDPGMLPFLKVVMKVNEKNPKVTDFLLFDPGDAEAKEVKIQNMDTFASFPDLIIAEGLFNESEKTVELVSKKAQTRIKFFAEEEILNQIEGLKDPGSSVFFYVNAGTGSGGPLGRGCAIVRVNASSDGKKSKKYAVYGASVVDLKPTKNESKIFDSDKAKEVAKWVASSHKARFC
jgi:hypothetical protein